jgi:hypothetical protein
LPPFFFFVALAAQARHVPEASSASMRANHSIAQSLNLRTSLDFLSWRAHAFRFRVTSITTARKSRVKYFLHLLDSGFSRLL